MARTAQRFGRTTSCGGVRNHLDGGAQIDPPARVHDQGADPWPRADPASDHRVAESKRARGAPTIAGPFAFGDQWPVCDADGRHAEHGAEVQRQTGPPGVITGSCVEQQHVRARRQTPRRLLHQRTDPEGEQSGNVRRTRHAGPDPLVDDVAFIHHQRSSPGRIARAAWTRKATREGHPAGADARPAVWRSPRLGSGVGQFLLERDQRVDVSGPHGPIVTDDERARCGG